MAKNNEKILNVRLTEEQHMENKIQAAKMKMTVKAYILYLVNEHKKKEE